MQLKGKYLYVDDEDAGTAELAITRTNQQSVAGRADQFGSFSIIIEDIIVEVFEDRDSGVNEGGEWER